MPLLEPNFYGLWYGKQTAKGTPQATPSHRAIQVAGDFNMPRDDGLEGYSDLTKYGATTDWVNSLLGNGEPGIEASPTELASILWLFHGAETVTVVTGPPAASKHTYIPSAGRGFYSTWYVRVGQSVIRRHQFNDCIITKVAIEGSTANKAVRVTPTILSLDPGVIFTTDPTQALPTDKTFLYTDATGTFTIDTVVFSGQSTFSLVIDDAWTPVFADDVVPFELVQGDPTVVIAVTVYLDATALTELNTLVYGTGAPTVGTKPAKRVQALGSYSAWFKQQTAAAALNGRELKVTLPGVKWTIPDYPGANPSGGATEITFSGQMRPLTPGATNPYTIDVNCASTDTAFTT